MGLFSKKPKQAVAQYDDQYFRAYAGGPFAGLIAQSRGAVIATMAFSFFSNTLVLIIPFYFFQLYDRVMYSRSYMTLAMLLAIAIFALVIQSVIETARSQVFAYISSWMDRKLSGEILSICLSEGLKRGFGGSTEPLRDLGTLRQFVTGHSIIQLLDVPWVPIFLLVLFMMDFWIGMVGTLGALFLLSMAWLSDIMTKGALRASGAASGRAMTIADVAVRNAEVVEALGMRRTMIDRWHKENDRSLQLQENASLRGAQVMAISKTGRMLVQILISTVSVIEIMQPDSNLSGGAMMASIILVGRALMPLEGSVSTFKQFIATRDAYDRLTRLFETKPLDEKTVMTLPRPVGDLLVEDLSLHIPGVPRPILSRVSFAVNHGEVLGIVGPSGAGKSSLARLLLGVNPPTSGKVRLDGADLHSWDSADLGQWIGYVPQDVELFNGTIRENICRFQEASAEEVIEAAKMAGLHELILRFPKGYDTQIGAGGSILSGGQRQRVALARALFRTPALLILDEPNASLDGAGEDALMNAIRAMKAAGSTVVLIAHKISLMSVADRMLVIQNGMVQRLGKREEVMPLITGQPAPAAVPPGATVHPLPARAGA